MMLFAM